MSNLRKDNYAVGETAFGPVYGKVLSTKGGVVVLATPGGESARLDPAVVTKISFDQYKASGGTTSATFDKADAGVVEAPAVTAADVGTVVEEKSSISRPGGKRQPGPAGTGKKAVAAVVYAQLDASGTATRKNVIAAFINEVGLSKAGANTYLQNFRSGKWSI